MSTVIRPETSEKNIYWLPRHRYYELKHFCMQYPDWKKARLALIGMACNSTEEEKIPTSKTNAISDPTGNEVIAISYFSDRINMVAVCLPFVARTVTVLRLPAWLVLLEIRAPEIPFMVITFFSKYYVDAGTFTLYLG